MDSDFEDIFPIIRDLLMPGVMEPSRRKRHGIRLIRDFLVPSLNENRYPGLLDWVNREEGLFRIFWKHQSSSSFEPKDAQVFQAWSVLKNKWDPLNRNSITLAKQRFRSAMHKLRASVQHESTTNEFRIYRIKNPWMYTSVASYQVEAGEAAADFLNNSEIPDIDFSLLLNVGMQDPSHT